MSKWIKNDSGSTKTWVGQEITNQSYYEIQSNEELEWANNSTLLTDIGSGDAVVAKDDSGNTDFSDVNEAIDYLKGDVPYSVKVLAFTDPNGVTNRFEGFSGTATKNTTTDIDFLIPYDRQLNGGYMMQQDGFWGDKFTFQIIDKDGVGVTKGWYNQATFDAMGNIYVANEFAKNWYVDPDKTSQHAIESSFTGTIYDGLYVRIKYTSVGTVDDVKIELNLFLSEKL